MLLTKPILYGAGVVVLGLALTASVQTWRLHSAKANLAEAKAALTVERSTNQRLAGEVEALNARFQEIRRQLAEAEAAKSAALIALEAGTKAAERALETERANLRRLYARSPEARAWAAQELPEGIAEGLGE